jgi:sialate O-acetylesterase
MISPLVPYGISGFIWYQGESNVGRAESYRTVFPGLIQDWRAQWGNKNLPFYFCQLPAFNDKKSTPEESAWAELREAQAAALELPRTSQAVILDLGEEKDLHPRNKRDVGDRLAKIALADTYGKSVPHEGPVFQSMRKEDGALRVSFAHSDGGLVARPLPDRYQPRLVSPDTVPLVRNSPKSQLEGFAICGSDQKWKWADAHIDGTAVVVSSPEVPDPVAVRYAWADTPTFNLFNGAGFPAAPFRTDKYPDLSAKKP